MILPETKHASFPRSALGGTAVCVLAAYLVAAYIFRWWPIPAAVPAACPATATNYQVFVDPTESNRDTENWRSEAGRFTRSLGACDSVSFWTVTSGSSSGARYGEPLNFPLLDPNVAARDRVPVEAEITRLRCQTEETIKKMMHQKGAPWSDIVGILNRLKPTDERSGNVLIVFSDGKESSPHGVDLEDGHDCVSPDRLQELVDRALKGRPHAEGLDRFEAIKWVVPSGSGVSGCNSRAELQLFWRGVIALSARSARPPSLVFDTNVF